MTKHMRRLVGLLLLTALLPAPAMADNETFLRESRRAIGAFFKDQGLMPVVLSAEVTPGDVLSWESWLVDEAASYCFPDLDVAGPSDIALPDVSFRGSFEASFLVALGEFFNLRAASAREFSVFVRYRDVKLTEATRGDLRRSLSNNCARFEPVLEEAAWSRETHGVPPLIVGRVVTAKQSVLVVASADRSAEIAAELGRLPIPTGRVIQVANPEMATSLGFTAESGLVVETDLELPVAVAPAFLFGLFPDQRGSNEEPSGDPVFAARAFDPDNDQHLKLFELTLKGVLDGPLERTE